MTRKPKLRRKDFFIAVSTDELLYHTISNNKLYITLTYYKSSDGILKEDITTQSLTYIEAVQLYKNFNNSLRPNEPPRRFVAGYIGEFNSKKNGYDFKKLKK